MIDKKELFKAYKEKVLKLNSRSSIIRCSNNILKKYVMDLTLFTDSYQQELLTWLLSDTIEEIIVDENSIENKFKTKIANLDKNQPIINDFDAVLGYNGLLDLDKTKQKLEEKKIRLISNGLAEINATYEIDKKLIKLMDLHKSRDMYLEDRKKLLREQDKFMLSCLKRIDSIDNKNREIQKQNGTYTLYAGYKFVYGKINKTIVNAPLVLIPITIERHGLKRIIKHSIDREVIINKPLLMLIESISNIKTNYTFKLNSADENWVSNLESKLFKDLSNINSIKSDRLLSISDKNDKESILSVYNAACIGIFNVSTSIYNDYTNMESSEPNSLINELIYGTNKKQLDIDNIELNLISTLDSSQEQAVYKSNLNNNLVIYGPPGTGKSQVITNIVADAISKGKRVLLVSEKKTALDVVHNRLGKLNKYALLIDDSGSIKQINHKIMSTESNYYLNHSSVKDKIDLDKQIIKNNLKKLDELYLELTLKNFEDTLSSYYKEAKKSLEADQLAMLICSEHPELLDISYRDLLYRIDNITDNQIKNIDLKDSQLLVYLGNKNMLDMRLDIEKINIYKNTQNKIKDLHIQLELVSEEDLYRIMHLYNDIIDTLTNGEFLIDNQINCLGDKKVNKLNLDEIIKVKELANKYREGIENQKKYIDTNDIDKIIYDKNVDKMILKHKYEDILNKLIVEQPRFIFEPIIKDYDNSIENIILALKIYHEVMNLGDKFNFNFNDTWINIEKSIKSHENIEYIKMLNCINNVIYTYKDTTSIRTEIDINKVKEICKKPKEFMYNNIALFKNKQNLATLLSARQLIENEINKNKFYINKGLEVINYIKSASINIGNSYEEVCNYLYNSKRYLETEIYNIDKEILKNRQDLYNTIKNNEIDTVNIIDSITKILKCNRCEVRETLNILRYNTQEEINTIDDLKCQLKELNIIVDNINNNELGKYKDEFYKIRHYDYTQITIDKLKDVELLDDISTVLTKILVKNNRNNLINGWLNAKIYKHTTSKLSSNIIEYDKAVKYIEQTQQDLIGLVIDEIDYRLHLDMSNRIAMQEIEFNDLKREATKLRRKKTARELVDNYFDLMKYLYPVWMMTPETVSDILPLKKDIFDVVIFDEASQMFLEKSLPSMYRAKKAIVAGDDKQLRPSSFFESNYISEQYTDIIDNSIGIDTSLLDQAKYTFEKCNLQFHYRSRFKELIQFNNKAFYNSNLKIAPNLSKTIDGKYPIIYKNVHGIHCNNSNKTEAIEVANIVKQLICNTNYTIGVVTLNYNQKELINSVIDELAADESNIEFATLLKNERNRIENNEDVSLFVKSI